MAINLVPEPTAGAPLGVADYNYQNALQQAVHGMNEYNNVLTEWETTTQPKIAVGARIIHDGGIYECQTGDETITGAPADGHVYIKLTEALGVLTASFVTSDAGYTYDPIKGGWYHADGTQLLPLKLLKYDSTYWKKTKLLVTNFNETSDLSSCQVYPWAAMEAIAQDDSSDSLLLPAGVTYFDFSSPNVINSAGVPPIVKHNVEWKNSLDANCFFNNRGISYINNGYVAYNYTFGNEMQIMLRIKPDFIYNVTETLRIFVNVPYTSALNDSIYLFYDHTIDAWRLIVSDNVPNNYYAINSDQYLDNATLQVETTFFIKISKANNNVDMWINGVKQDGIGAGTKTLTGTIVGLNITSTKFWIGAESYPIDEWYYTGASSKFYIQDMLISNTYGETYLANFDASDDKPYYKTTNFPLQQHAALVDVNGNAGFNNLFVEKLIGGSIDIGAGQIKMKKIPIGVWNMDSMASVTIAHGLDVTKFLFVSVRILPDSGATYYADLNFLDSAGNFYIPLTTEFILGRGGAGAFDNTAFDGSANRGWITIIYMV